MKHNKKFVTFPGKMYAMQNKVCNILWMSGTKKINYPVLRSIIERYKNDGRSLSSIAWAIIGRYEDELKWQNGIVSYIYKERDSVKERK